MVFSTVVVKKNHVSFVFRCLFFFFLNKSDFGQSDFGQSKKRGEGGTGGHRL